MSDAASEKPAPDSLSEVNEQSPWLGLQPFEEKHRRFFFGRNEEVSELRRRIERQPLTILYGESGWGKTSLLRAQLIPELREESAVIPVRVRLDFPTREQLEKTPEVLSEWDLVAQVRETLRASLRAAGLTEAAEAIKEEVLPPGATDLWALFHDSELPFVGENAIRPVLLFDQFEEIFTRGESVPAAVETFRRQLAAVVENNPPSALTRRLRHDPSFQREYDYQATTARILMVLRHDYLHRLERWRSIMPRLLENRFELRLLDGPRAFEAVYRPGCLADPNKPLLEELVAENIVRVVAGAEANTPLSEIGAVPPLLSLMCRQLNEQRLAEGLDQIPADMVEARQEEILENFYEEAFHGLPHCTRVAIEQTLLSRGGQIRESPTRATVVAELERLGLKRNEAESVLGQLAARRLIAPDERGGEPRVELTHDVLAPIAARSRDARQEKEAVEKARRERQRLLRWVTILAVLLLIASGAGVYAVIANTRAQAAKANAVEALERAKRAEASAESRLAEAEAARVDANEARERAEEAERISETRLAEAEAARATAETLIGEMLFDLRDGLKPLGRLDLLDDVSAAAERYFEQFPEESLSDEALRRKGVMLNNRGNVALAQGDAEAARKFYEDGLAIRKELAQRDPSNTQWQRDLSLSYNKLGDIAQDQGDAEAARKFFEDGRVIAQDLAQRDPSNTLWQGDLSFSFDKLGDIAQKQGNAESARNFYEDGLAIRKDLAERNPSNTERQRDLTISYDRLGDIAQNQGDPEAARKFYEDSLAIRKDLTEHDPSNTQWQRDLSLSYEKLGVISEDQGDAEAARKFHEDGLAIAQDLAQRDPSNTVWQRDLAFSYSRLGDIAQDQGDAEAANKFYEDSLAIRKDLAERDPSNTEWQRDLFLSYVELGNIAQKQGDAEAARKFFEDGLAIAQDFAQRDPERNQVQIWTDLVVSYSKLGSLPSLSREESAQAIAWLEEGLDILSTLAEDGRLTTEQQGWVTWFEGQIETLQAEMDNTP